MSHNSSMKTIVLTMLALFAFAANSVLCRLALKDGAIDASSYTILRLLSGTLILLIILFVTGDRKAEPAKGSWTASFMLFVYMATFSYAYLLLDTGTGALIIAGSVQITMILLSVIAGTRLHLSEWTGMAIASAGFVYLVLPGVTTPSITGFLLMSVAGMAWGVYTLKGRASKNPLMDTAYNFLRTMPLILLLGLVTLGDASYSMEGIVLALISGSVTSGIGYAIWYIALGGLSATVAAVLQLSIAVIAALGGVLFVSEEITIRLALSSALVLGGILIVILGRVFFVSRSFVSAADRPLNRSFNKSSNRS